MSNEQGFVSADKLTWLDISDEQYRVYVYADGFRYTVSAPLKLNVKQKANGDSHRIQTASGGIYIPPGWRAIEWTVKAGANPVAF